MAYNFNGSNQSIDATSAVLTAAPITMSILMNVNNVTTRFVILSISERFLVNDHFATLAAGNISGDPIQALSQQAPGIGGIAATSTGFSASTWHSAISVFSAANSRAAYLDGAGKGTDTNNVVPTVNTTSIGRLWRNFDNNWTNGRLAEAGIWNAALTDDEVASLAKGFKPYRVRPQSLVFYVPLVRNISDLRNRVSLTNNNAATVAAHPRVY
jgi:hypothetical protein